jgi:hypothetical protein
MNLQSTILAFIGGKHKKTPSGWHTINCPMCMTQGHTRNDNRHRGGFKFSEVSSYHCFNCGYKASYTPGRLIGRKMRDLLVNIGVPETKVKELQFLAMKEKDDTVITNKTIQYVNEFEEKQLPTGTKLLSEVINSYNPPSNALFVYKYLIDRSLDFYNKFYWTTDPYMRLNERVIIPFYAHKKLVGYTARIIKEYENVPKYYSVVQPGYIYNFDNLYKDRKYIIITEGVLDALAIDSVSSLGNKLTQGQIDLINSVGKTVIICPDRDKSGGNLVDVAIENNWLVSFPQWEKHIKDCAEAVNTYGRLYTVQSVINGAIGNVAKIKVLKKIGAAING